MTKEFILQEFDDTFSLLYNVSHTGPDEAKFYVPLQRISLKLEIYVNDNRLDATSHCVERIRNSLLSSFFWKQLFFDVSLLDDSESSLCLDLKCKLFANSHIEFKHAENIAHVEKLHLVFKYFTRCPLVYYTSLFNNLQYCLSSLMLDLEKELPFVFSFYGKHLYEINYNTMLRCYTELNTPLVGSGKADQAEMLQLVLEKLNHFMLTKYNTIEVMKECDKSSYRLQQCKKSIHRPRCTEDTRNLRNIALTYRMLADEPGRGTSGGSQGV